VAEGVTHVLLPLAGNTGERVLVGQPLFHCGWNGGLYEMENLDCGTLTTTAIEAHPSLSTRPKISLPVRPRKS
jgi:hypothetical protein